MTFDDQPTRPANQNHPVPVAGIGASAGGVQALQAFFSALPADTDAAYVVILHLDPERASQLAHILSGYTKMPVQEVHDTAAIVANSIYVIPPNRRLVVSGDQISTAPFDEPRGQRSPIDQFFRSLAKQHGDGFAIILSGAGSDGANGVKDIKENGGLVLVQDPMEAEYPSMPRAAIGSGTADLVLPVREIALRMPELVRKKGQLQAEHLAGSDERDEADSRVPSPEDGPRLRKLQASDSHSQARPPDAGDPDGQRGSIRFLPKGST